MSNEKRAVKQKGLVMVYTGNGKGKTTAALGMLMRAWGRNMKVAAIQFIKDEGRLTGEKQAAARMGIEMLQVGDGFTWESKDMDQSTALARHGWEIAKQKILDASYEIILLDEFTFPLRFKWLDTAEVIQWLKENKPQKLHIVITGRHAPKELVQYADLVTEMREIKHPFHDQGLLSQPGVDY
ncbi:MAG: cob(I)yrinic acid a,c-diamide adenosyltransferase [Anaerolineae bacterium]|jgi:cob(I)alamin adenosyltransferase|nr:cob(I)yrinic acid a,c-diamide adenosyltransferase [Anaerolineae bacterium]